MEIIGIIVEMSNSTCCCHRREYLSTQHTHPVRVAFVVTGQKLYNKSSMLSNPAFSFPFRCHPILQNKLSFFMLDCVLGKICISDCCSVHSKCFLDAGNNCDAGVFAEPGKRGPRRCIWCI